jgi:hypothetical protein
MPPPEMLTRARGEDYALVRSALEAAPPRSMQRPQNGAAPGKSGGA